MRIFSKASAARSAGAPRSAPMSLSLEERTFSTLAILRRRSAAFSLVSSSFLAVESEKDKVDMFSPIFVCFYVVVACMV